LVGEPVKWLRYMLDRIAAFAEPHCPDDWNDGHMDFEYCCRCERVEARNVRLASYRAAKRLPKARVKVITP